MIRTPLCDLVGIEYPVFQGGMAWIADGKLAAAVSEGGGLGIIAAGNAPGDYVREQIHIAKSLTEKPFGVNIMLMSPFVEEVARVVAEEQVAVVTTGAGNPSKYMALWKEAGVKVIPVVASVAMARLMTRLGASALIAEGGESGGHVGELTTMVLVPQVCDVTPLPVIAAGGIADGRGVAAAFMLGACGVQMGTRFLSAEECSIHPEYKNRILKATDLCTMVTGKKTGHPVRSLRTNFPREYAKAEFGGVDEATLDEMAAGRLRLAVEEGDLEKGCFLSGQVAAMVKKVQPAAEIVREVMEGAEPILKGATQWVK
ncbi:enoyl-[acyl-carrier-protein] reductase FabK [Evtepia sp.]|uniref:enoyl-[acyl-carrier-protein] reductase FabK n=1 Tax=Evtepia sp. TaxID=2773933 RepID=UPI003F164589